MSLRESPKRAPDRMRSNGLLQWLDIQIYLTVENKRRSYSNDAHDCVSLDVDSLTIKLNTMCQNNSVSTSSP